MDEDGIQKFCDAIGVNMESDIVCLLISQKMQAECMGEYKKSEFLKGAEVLGCNTISDWKAIVPKLRTDLQNKETFKEMYKFVFGFGCEKGYKALEVESAVQLWDLLIG